MTARILSIYSGSEPVKPLQSTPSAQLEAGRGIVGDRYYLGTGTFSEKLAGTPDVEITLIAQEEIDAFNEITGKDYSGADFRRNLVTRGIYLNDLVGQEFSLGNQVLLRGVRLCEPCAHLAGFLGQEIMAHMVHKAGLRAQIVSGGLVCTGDSLSVIRPV